MNRCKSTAHDFWVNFYPINKMTKFNDDIDILVTSEAVSFIRISNGINQYHRLDGPSFISNVNTLFWAFNGDAVASFYDGKWSGIFYDWCLDNKIDIWNLTDDNKLLIKLSWCNHGNV